ncbi:hypothetical protein G7077_09685 [Sphingomonas piscis]|uniref:Sortilin N-terminal domain-containing protein n=1 Tax=Sphingomonas piscis TaxID=2714943 RepID=A0A6G7YQW8_9SPHN|nr:sialidase family protein [Sphingomonas piscis]QIK79127.1 hypothetical protein G7077_09685 [Sphingomonas piscis]
MPKDDHLVSTGNATGVYAIRVAPSDARRVYMVAPAFNGSASWIYRSDDRGEHWSRTNFRPQEMSVQSAGRTLGPKMAISPENPNVVFVGDSAGRIYRTVNGGETWEVARGVPVGSEPAIAFVKNDFGPIGLVVSTGTNGTYWSDDLGENWTSLVGGPASIARLYASNGVLFATDRENNSPYNAWKLTQSQWRRLNIKAPGRRNSWHSIAISPINPDVVVLGAAAGNIAFSEDGGATWNDYYMNAPSRIAKDVPWLAKTNESWMTNGNMLFDPMQPDGLLFAEGIGIWRTIPSRSSAQPVWHSQTRGIEELIVNDLVVPPGGTPIVAVQDRGVFTITNPGCFPESHGPAYDVPIRHGWAVDYAAGNPRFIALIANGGANDRSGYSTDGGQSWQPFVSSAPAKAPGHLGGSIAVSTDKNFVWAPSNNGRPFYTRDGGRSWQIAEFPADTSSTGALGWTFSMYQNRHVFAADRVKIGTFYAYNYGPSANKRAAGIYRSGDGGATWTKVSKGFGIPGSIGTSARLMAVPGMAGHLLFAAGTTGLTDKHPYGFALQASRDGGVTWRALGRTQEVWAAGFGRAAAGRSYPTIFIAGFANGDLKPGIFCSVNEGLSWTRLTEAPFGNPDGIRAISGDMQKTGRVYFGFSGSGAGYGVFQACQ